MLRRELLDEVAPRLSGIGTKILIDILPSAPQPLRVVELPYGFRRATGVRASWMLSPRSNMSSSSPRK